MNGASLHIKKYLPPHCSSVDSEGNNGAGPHENGNASTTAVDDKELDLTKQWFRWRHNYRLVKGPVDHERKRGVPSGSSKRSICLLTGSVLVPVHDSLYSLGYARNLTSRNTSLDIEAAFWQC